MNIIEQLEQQIKHRDIYPSHKLTMLNLNELIPTAIALIENPHPRDQEFRL